MFKLKSRSFLLLYFSGQFLFLLLLMHLALFFETDLIPLAVGGFTISFLTNLATARFITKPIEKLSKVVQSNDIVANDMVNVHSDDVRILMEILCKDHNKVVESKARFEDIAKELSAMMVEVSDATAHIADATQLQSTSIANGSDSIHSLLRDIEVANDHLASTNEEMKKVEDNVSTGESALSAVTGSQDKCMNLARKANLTISKIIEKFDEVNSTISEIQEVADQVNILSINTAIEASKAGAAGEGFAVIASRVQSLADQCKTLSKSVASTVPDLSASISSCGENITEMCEAIDAESANIGALKQNFSDITSSTDATAISTNGLVGLFTSIKETCSNLVITMETLSSTAEETAAAAEQVTSSSNEELSYLNKVADGVKQLSA